MTTNSVQKARIRKLILELKKIQDFFLEKYGVNDIYSNSKIPGILAPRMQKMKVEENLNISILKKQAGIIVGHLTIIVTQR